MITLSPLVVLLGTLNALLLGGDAVLFVGSPLVFGIGTERF